AKRDWWVFDGDSVIDNARKLGLAADMVTDAAMGNADQMKTLNDELSQYAFGTDAAARKAEELGISQVELGAVVDDVRKSVLGETGSIEESIAVARDKKDATKDSADASQNAADAYIAEAKTVEDLSSKLSKLIETINAANGANQDAITASISYQDTLREVDQQIANITAGVQGFGLGLDETTAAGADNKAMLVDLAKDAWDAAAAQLQLDQNTAGFSERLEQSRQRLYDAAIQMGATEGEAAHLRDTILAMPDQKTIQMIAQTQEAQSEIDNFVNRNNNKTITLFANAQVQAANDSIAALIRERGFADGGVVRGYANGGIRFNAAGNVYRPENHVAQIARAGEYRVWAEPETGGESYIPHAPSKRTRSEQLMGETASILGGTYIPSTARIEQAAPAGGAITVVLESKGDIDLLRYIDVRVEQGVQGVRSEFRGA
ncbi:hypothetical protein ABE10_02325, partial [Bacillus toyonensis]|nr:hypothetical protein [Bacillus toyonensis]